MKLHCTYNLELSGINKTISYAVTYKFPQIYTRVKACSASVASQQIAGADIVVIMKTKKKTIAGYHTCLSSASAVASGHYKLKMLTCCAFLLYMHWSTGLIGGLCHGKRCWGKANAQERELTNCQTIKEVVFGTRNN